MLSVCLGVYAQVRYTVVCLCVDCYSSINLDFNSWICKIMLRFSEECVAKFVHRILVASSISSGLITPTQLYHV